MNNTELTLDQLSEIAGGPAYGMDNSSFTSNSKMKKPINQCSDWSCADWCR